MFIQVYRILRFFHLISKKKFKKKYPAGYMIIAKSALFDKSWYIKFNNINSKMDPVLHYLNTGWKEGCNPSSSFDGNAYLETYPDISKNNINPLVHWEMFGKSEGRQYVKACGYTVCHRPSALDKIFAIINKTPKDDLPPPEHSTSSCFPMLFPKRCYL